MPEEETELTAVEAGKEAASEAAATEAETAAAETKPEAEAAAEASAAAPEAETVPREEFDKLKAERDELKAERDKLVERQARMQAEFENARKRAEREKTDYRDYAVGSVVERFLPVMDNFELALKATGSAEQTRSGVELIVKQMEEVLKQLDVKPVPAVGEAFDPRQHEALGTVEREDLPDQHVAEEVRKGYKLRDRLLRPSLVRVVSNPKQQSE